MRGRSALAIVARAEASQERFRMAWSGDDVAEFLAELREALTAEQREREELRRDLASELLAEQFMAVLYTSALRQVEGERDRARATAVRLEQDLADASTDHAEPWVFPCAWCGEPSKGTAYQFTDHTYPERSCGEHGHHFRADQEVAL